MIDWGEVFQHALIGGIIGGVVGGVGGLLKKPADTDNSMSSGTPLVSTPATFGAVALPPAPSQLGEAAAIALVWVYVQPLLDWINQTLAPASPTLTTKLARSPHDALPFWAYLAYTDAGSVALGVELQPGAGAVLVKSYVVGAQNQLLMQGPGASLALDEAQLRMWLHEYRSFLLNNLDPIRQYVQALG